MEKEVSEYDFLEADLITNIELMHSNEKDLNTRANNLERDIQRGEKDLIKLKKLKKKLVKKNKSIASVQKKKVIKKQTASRLLNFSLPLSKFEKIQKDKNGGVNLYVRSDREILSPEAGTVMYTGKLSTYGNVVVIKHQNDYQSIIFRRPNFQRREGKSC